MAAPDPITAWEDAIIARCTEVLVVDGKKLVRQVESLPGDWDDDTLKRLVRAVPGVFVVFSGGPSRPGMTAEIDARWVLYVVTGHASGEAARRRGDGLDAGAYLITAMLVSALHNWSPDLSTNSLELVDVANLYTGSIDRQGVAIYAITFKAPLAFAAIDPGELADFLTFVSNLDMPQHSPLPVQQLWLEENFSVGQPDARDEVKPPQVE